jgi:hypothetical protein
LTIEGSFNELKNIRKRTGKQNASCVTMWNPGRVTNVVYQQRVIRMKPQEMETQSPSDGSHIDEGGPSGAGIKPVWDPIINLKDSPSMIWKIMA